MEFKLQFWQDIIISVRDYISDLFINKYSFCSVQENVVSILSQKVKVIVKNNRILILKNILFVWTIMV